MTAPRWFSESNLHFPRVQDLVSRDTRHLLVRLLHQNPGKRCSSAEEIVLQLRPLMTEQAGVERVRSEKRKKSIPVWVWVLISALALIAGAALALWRAL